MTGVCRSDDRPQGRHPLTAALSTSIMNRCIVVDLGLCYAPHHCSDLPYQKIHTYKYPVGTSRVSRSQIYSMRTLFIFNRRPSKPLLYQEPYVHSLPANWGRLSSVKLQRGHVINSNNQHHSIPMDSRLPHYSRTHPPLSRLLILNHLILERVNSAPITKANSPPLPS